MYMFVSESMSSFPFIICIFWMVIGAYIVEAIITSHPTVSSHIFFWTVVVHLVKQSPHPLVEWDSMMNS